MSSSEDDYMSDAFLKGCEKEDIRPGLIFSHSAKRNHELHKKKQDKDDANKNNYPSAKVVESEKRDVALNQPISDDNKGFAMLQKLGFKPGSGLGKSSAGRTEPVPITLKTDRQGLGHAEALKESLVMKATKRKEIYSKLTNVDNYRSHLAEKTAERRAIMDLRKSQRICKQLDTNLGFLEPDELWYWPDCDQKESDKKSDDCDIDEEIDDGAQDSCSNTNENDEDKEEEEEDEDGAGIVNEDYTVKEKLEMVTYYLRKVHYYCVWCAVQYDDDRDLEVECPGSTYEDH